MIDGYKYALIIVASALFLNFIPSMGNNEVQVIVEFNSIYTDFNLFYLKLLGYNFEVIDKLHNVVNGAVIRISPEQVDRLRNEIIVSNVYEEKFLKTNLEKSLKLIGLDDVSVRYTDGMELNGAGVRIAVVDTGIDYTHPDLFGFGNGGKIAGGYDFLERDDAPMDTDGHGTLVAGIIAADGKVKGVAPKAELIAYRIASEGDYVSTVDMIRALDRAVDDKINVVNISLGLDYISEEIDAAIEKLVDEGVVVVTAAGNNGQAKHIGSPASAPSAISVGASLNNVTLSAVSTLEVKNHSTKFDTIPMLGSVVQNKPVTGKLVFANFAKAEDFEGLDVKGAIVLAERGGPIIEVGGRQQVEIIYFTDKEMNAAINGAAALIVYNNLPGNFAGTLISNQTSAGYEPSIPVVSISMEEGLMLRSLMQQEDVIAELNIFYNPDIVASFSSRGPVSPFYLKPTIVAPGAFINSTSIQGSYSVTSGTSFAAPHVTGAVALLLQKNPNLKPAEVASILATTAKPLSDAYGLPYTFDAGGAGRLDVDAALKTDLIAIPYYVILHLSPGKEISKEIVIRSISDDIGELDVTTQWDHPIRLNAKMERADESTANLTVSAKLTERIAGKYEGRVNIGSGENKISLLVIVYADEVGLKASNRDGRIWLSIDSDENWTFAKVKVINAENKRGHSVTLTPSNNLQSVPARSAGEHWIEADVITSYGDVKGFSVLQVSDVTKDSLFYDYLNIYGVPFKEALMIASFLGITAAVAYVWNRTKRNVDENLQEGLQQSFDN